MRRLLSGGHSVLAVLFLLCGLSGATAQTAAVAGGATGVVCKGLAVLTKTLANDPDAAKDSDVASMQMQKMQAWADVFARSGMTPEEFDANVKAPDLAAMMANVEATANPQAALDKKTDEASLKWTGFDIARTSLSVAGIVDPIGATSIVAAYLYPKCSTSDAQSGQGNFCWKDSEVRGAGLIPKGCDPSHPEYQNGLCYSPCPAGMKGEGPVCWTESKISAPRGVGKVPDGCPSDKPDKQGGLCYQSCPEGYGGVGPVCWKGLSSKARGVGTAPNACDSAHPDADGGLCYAACQPNYKGIGPVCWSTQKVSNPRGVGTIPTGCAADTPVNDAGLCYKTCRSGSGVGPVCWAGCGGRFSEACGAGCATNKVECGFATTDMVSSPLEMVMNVVTLGTASAETSALRTGRKVAREAAEKAAKLQTKALKEAAESGDEFVRFYARAAKEMGNIQDADTAKYILDMANEAPQISTTAAKTATQKMKSAYKAAKQSTDNTVNYIKKAGDSTLVEFVSKWAKKISPKQVAANSIESTERGKKFLGRLQMAYDKAHFLELAAAENMIVGCAKFGLAVSKAALGAQGK